MPKKSRRVAVRQAELSQKKRRGAKHPSGDEAQAPIAQVGASAHVERPRAAIPSEAPGPDIPRRVPQERPAAPYALNPYIWPEIKRIGLLTGLVLVILAVLTVVLR